MKTGSRHTDEGAYQKEIIAPRSSKTESGFPSNNIKEKNHEWINTKN